MIIAKGFALQYECTALCASCVRVEIVSAADTYLQATFSEVLHNTPIRSRHNH